MAHHNNQTLWATHAPSVFPQAPPLGLSNPGVTATYGLIGSALAVTPAALTSRARRSLASRACPA